MTNPKPHIILLMLGLVTSYCAHGQYKSRLFVDSSQQLSESEQQNIVALQSAFANYTDTYQIASTAQFLARAMLAAEDYQSAAEYYAATLKTQVFDESVAVQLRREYAMVLLKLKHYAQVNLVFDGQTLDVEERFLLARASIGLEQYHQVVDWLLPLSIKLSDLNDVDLAQLAGLYYRAKALQLAAEALSEQLNRNPQDIAIARQLTGIHIQRQRYDQALDLWSLTFSRELTKQESDWILLADLYNRQGSPEKAARLLHQGIQEKLIAGTDSHYYKLFEFWYRAKETESARHALWQSVQRSRNIEHGLILAELLQSAQLWQSMEEVIVLTCQTVLPDRFVGRINLMLGIAKHKLGNNEEARRAFINASLVSGVSDNARQWLTFIGAKAATLQESERLQGECLPEDPKVILPDSLYTKANTDKQFEQNSKSNSVRAPKEFEITILPAMRFYGEKLHTSTTSLGQDITGKTLRLMKTLLRAGGKVDGELHLLLDDMQNVQGPAFTLAYPVTGAPSNQGPFRMIRMTKQKAITRPYRGNGEGLKRVWQSLATMATGQGLTPTGQSRIVFVGEGTQSDTLNVKLQLIVE